MTQALRLQRIGETDISLDLLGGPLQVLEGTQLEQGQQADEGGAITRTLKIGGKATSPQVIQAEGYLGALQEAVQSYGADRLTQDITWLYERAEGEAAERRAFVYGFDYRQSEDAYSSRLLGRDAALFDLAITRHPYWEATDAVTMGDSGVGQGSLQTLSNTPSPTKSQRPGRVWQLSLYPASGGADATSYTDRYWFGMRRKRYGYSQLKLTWELESGTRLNGTALTYQAGASPIGSVSNNVNACTFSTYQAMTDRCKVAISQIKTGGSNAVEYVGRYMVLLRARAETGMSCYVRMKAGYSNGIPYPEVMVVGSPYYQLYELGEVQIPPFGYRLATASAANFVNEFGITIAAEWISGPQPNALIMDCLYLVPLDGYAFSNGVRLTNGNRRSFWWTYEDDSTFAMSLESNIPIAAVDYRQSELYIPPEGGIYTALSERYDTTAACRRHEITDTTEMFLYYYLRYKGFIG